eukprot:jgi/Tetstr1/456658/TSEL_043359.t1
MTFIGKLGHTFKAFGSKVAGAASYLGHKVGSGLMTLAPAISVLSPTVGAGFAAAGAAAQGIGVLGDVGKKALSGGGVDFGQAKAALRPSQGGMHSVKAAYQSGSNRSGLERRASA